MKNRLRRGLAIFAGVTYLAAWALSPPPVAASTQQTQPEPDRLATKALSLLFFDAAGLAPAATASMRDEIANVLRQASVEPRSLDPDTAAAKTGFRVSIIVLPRAPSGRKRGRCVMGLATKRQPRPGDYRSVRVFVPNVAETMGRCGRGFTEAIVGRAIGRVAAHELIHVLAPDYGHSSSARNLMNSGLDCSLLFRAPVRLDPAAIAAVRAGLDDAESPATLSRPASGGPPEAAPCSTSEVHYRGDGRRAACGGKR